MKYAELPPNETILQILDAAANMEVKASTAQLGSHQPAVHFTSCMHFILCVCVQSSRRVKDQDGFRGYYTIWKRVMCEDLDANASEQLVVA